ncbi:glycosyltransferase family 2 protein [Yersinia hibernica]|uniref:Nucleotidyl transferase domain-containing protein n=1 Tax=Yersinia hibernica TaxID=2339259 RepID=A0ABX5R1G3_9GAMM|nr:glycosyltransferase family 2 protein [Yersinia hibernica]QAX79176.1 hypothetical protein D5F51_11770 [Yersinia hibernica]
MNILILAAGDNYIDPDDKNYPLCLSEVNGVPLIQRVTDQLSFNDGEVVYLFQDKYIKRYHLDDIVKLISDKKFSVFPVPDNTAGAACTALLGTVSLPQSESLLIVSGNQLVDVDIKNFIDEMNNNNYDAGTIIFDSIHPRYSYVMLNDEGLVTEASEKKPISRNATAGTYWFRKTSDFTDAVKNMIRKDAKVDGRFYICPSFNELILKGLRVGVIKIDPEQYHPLKTIRQIEIK